MKCAYHPHKEAVSNCSMCRKPLCEECGEPKADANILCSRCAALSAARDAANGEDDRQMKHEEKKTAAAKKRQKPHVAMIVVIILSVIVLAANVYMYMGPSVPDVAEFDPDQHPLLTADFVNDGIEAYAQDHGGRFPGKLTDLLGKYIPYEKITPSVLDMFSYRRFSPTSYELRFKDATHEEFSDIVFGKEDN
jgi:hypothetical protein